MSRELEITGATTRKRKNNQQHHPTTAKTTPSQCRADDHIGQCYQGKMHVNQNGTHRVRAQTITTPTPAISFTPRWLLPRSTKLRANQEAGVTITSDPYTLCTDKLHIRTILFTY